VGAGSQRQGGTPFAPSSLDDPRARAFVESLPERYRTIFDASAAVEHAAIVERRRGADIHMEAWREAPDGGAVVCVVAEDGPGLLALLSATFIAHDIDVVAAHAFCRTLDGGVVEAVDLFWLRRVDDVPIDAAFIAVLLERLVPLWGGRLSEESIEAAGHLPRPRSAPTALTYVSFADSPGDGGFVLTVQTHDRPGLLFAITRTLFGAGLRIARSEVRTKSGVVCDRFHLLEADGSPVREERRTRVQADVHAAIASLASSNPLAKPGVDKT
jgi:[protein-PII] uridylyltransferase